MLQQFYNIHASFLVPAYNMPKNTQSAFITTQHGQHSKGSISIDVWLVNATENDPLQSMVASLRQEEQNYAQELEKTLAEEKPTDEMTKSPKVRTLEHGKKVFAQLVVEAGDSVFHKKPDEQFLQIAKQNLARQPLSQYQPDLNNFLYLAGLSYYVER